jgi:acyl-CoA reductase-like NAD-dependent aldehyde dehydrogenase
MSEGELTIGSPRYGRRLPLLPDAGAVALGRHPRIAVLTLTGLGRCGRRLLAHVAESNGKRMWPAVCARSGSAVPPAAGLAAGGSTTAWDCFYGASQMCSASSLLIVHRVVTEDALATACTRAKQTRPSVPLSWDGSIGGVFSQQACNGVFASGGKEDEESAIAFASDSRGLTAGSYIAPIALTDQHADFTCTWIELAG